jgi:hypothetical protein
MQHRVRLTGKQAVVEARLAGWLQRKSVLEVGQAVMKEMVEWQLPAFARANHNVAAVAAHLDMLPAPSTDRVSEVYQRLKSIHDTTTMQQAESSLMHRVKASILPPPLMTKFAKAGKIGRFSFLFRIV